MDPLRGSPWSAPATVAGFARSTPNETLTAFAKTELLAIGGTGVALDLGCGAGRNLIPLAQIGWDAVGVDLSRPMAEAALERLRRDAAAQRRVRVALAAMDAVPMRDRSVDLIVAHGIWNLARSGDEFRRAIAEAARVAKPRAALFVFTFSRHTLAPAAEPVSGEPFVFTQFSGAPQCFLTEAQLLSELSAAGFTPDPAIPLRELNRPQAGSLSAATPPPVIYEGLFRFTH